MTRRFRDSWAFLRTYWRNQQAVGAVLPSGRSLARAMAEPLRRSHSAQPRVLEVGPGTGIVTSEIVPHLGDEGWLDVVELQEEFVRHLESRFEKEPPLAAVRGQVAIHHTALQEFAADRFGSAVRDGTFPVTDANPRVGPEERYDFIISGLPLNNFAPEVVEQLMRLFCELLKPGGVLSYFEYMYLRGLRGTLGLPATRLRFAQLNGVLANWLTHEIRRDNAWLNVPPAWVHHLSFEEVRVA